MIRRNYATPGRGVNGEAGAASVVPSAVFNPTVHGARGLFALMVFAFHITNSGLANVFPANSPVETYLLNSMKFGVELFFGVSGYVIVGALRRSPSVRSFLWERATRIYPLLWLTLIAIATVSWAVGHWLPPPIDLALNFLAPPPFPPLPQVNPAAWSLGYEITFYGLCALAWALRRRGAGAWAVPAIAIGAVLVVLLPRAALMPIGVLIGAGLLDRPLAVRAASLPALSLLVFLLSWRAIELWAPIHDMAALTPIGLGVTEWLKVAPLMLLSATAGGLALRGIAGQRGLLARGLRWPLMQWLGTISFSFYLWQPLIMSMVKSALISSGAAAAAGPGAQLLFALIALPPTLLVAHYSHDWVEVKLTRRLRRLGPREGSHRAPITAAADRHAAAPAPGAPGEFAS